MVSEGSEQLSLYNMVMYNTVTFSDTTAGKQRDCIYSTVWIVLEEFVPTNVPHVSELSSRPDASAACAVNLGFSMTEHLALR